MGKCPPRFVCTPRGSKFFFNILFLVMPAFLSSHLAAQELTLQEIVTPSTVVMKDGHPVTFAIYGFIEFKSLSEAFRYIDSQYNRWPPPGLLADFGRASRARELLNHAVESRVVSMADERPLELLLTHTDEELKRAISQVKEPLPAGYEESFHRVREKWKHSLNCWSASPVMAGRVLSNWYPIEEGIRLYGATYDSTEHFWQAVKYHPDVTVADLTDLLTLFRQQNWGPWLATLEDDPQVYLKHAYAIEFLHHNLTAARLQWFQEELMRQGLHPSDHPRQAQQRGERPFRFSAFEEKVLWGDLADLFHLVYVFSIPQDSTARSLAERHFDGIYLGDRRMKFISNDFSSLMLEIWKVKYLEMPRFREVIASIPMEILLEHFLNDGDSPDIPIPIYVGYLNRIRKMARDKSETDSPQSHTGTKKKQKSIPSVPL